MNHTFIILLLLLLSELFYFRIASRLGITDRPNIRSSHRDVTLRGGGVVFLLSAWIYAAFYGFSYLWFLTGLTLISAISFADDIHSVPNRIRIVIHFAAILLLFRQLNILTIEDWWIVLPAWIVCTGIINAYNFMDGINGITGGYSLVVLLPLALVNSSLHFVDMRLITVTTWSVAVFCLFNFRTKAKCFAGDVGSVSIAFILLFILGSLIIRTEQLWYLIFMAVYGVDSFLTICHRLLLHENIFEPHRKHAYQLLANELHIPHVAVSGLYMAIQLLVSLGAIYLPVEKWLYFVVVIAILTTMYVVFKNKYYHLHEEYLKSKP